MIPLIMMNDVKTCEIKTHVLYVKKTIYVYTQLFTLAYNVHSNTHTYVYFDRFHVVKGLII